MKPVFVKVPTNVNTFWVKEYLYDELRRSGYHNHLNNYKGVYILWNKNNPLYIGQSQNTLVRIITHLRGQGHLKLNKNVVTGCTILPLEYIREKDDSMCVKSAEKYLIRLMKPEKNVLLRNIKGG